MSKKIIICLFLLLTAASLFASGGEAMPWDSGLVKIQKSLGGPTAVTIGILMIIGAGIAMAFTEGQAIKKLFWVVIGLGIALNAAAFASMIFGSGSGHLIF